LQHASATNNAPHLQGPLTRYSSSLVTSLSFFDHSRHARPLSKARSNALRNDSVPKGSHSPFRPALVYMEPCTRLHHRSSHVSQKIIAH
jgi:hypothetical protein